MGGGQRRRNKLEGVEILHVNFVQIVESGDGQCPPLDDKEHHCGERCSVLPV